MNTTLITTAGLLVSATLMAQDFAFDFNRSYAPDQVQDGFTELPVDDIQQPEAAPFTVADPGGTGLEITVFGSESVEGKTTLTDLTGINGRYRSSMPDDAGAYNQNYMMRERIIAAGEKVGSFTDGTGEGLYISVEGLKPETEYTIQVWGVDSDNKSGFLKTGTVTGWDATHETAGLVQLGTYKVPASTDTIEDNHAYSITGTIKTNSEGQLIYKSIADIDGVGIANGFTLKEATEPASAQASMEVDASADQKTTDS